MRVNCNIKKSEECYDVQPGCQKKHESPEDIYPMKIFRISGELDAERYEHQHHEVQIGYVYRGCIEHHCQGEFRILTMGSLFLLPQGVSHKLKLKSGEADLICCEFPKGFLLDCLVKQKKGNSTIDFLFVKSVHDLQMKVNLDAQGQNKAENIMTDMLYEYDYKLSCYEINLKAGLMKLISLMIRNAGQGCEDGKEKLLERYKDGMNQAVRFINENYTNPIYIEDVCKVSMLSHTYFSCLFKEITGKTFTEYLNTLRIKKAVELLKDHCMTVSDACFNVGFSDVSYFTKMFRKLTGMSPSQYRQSIYARN